MLYKVRIRRKDCETIMLYDSYNNLLLDESYSIFTKCKKVVGEGEGTHLRVWTGFSCNMGCSYCFQKDMNTSCVPPVSKKDIESLHKSILWYFAESRENTLWLSFAGGEPLLYWEEIKSLVDLLSRDIPDICVSITTNGTLFSADIANYAIKKKFRFTLSHDGEGQRLRGADPLGKGTKTLPVWRYYAANCDIEGFRIASTLTRYNYDISKIRAYVMERLGLQEIKLEVSTYLNYAKDIDAFSLSSIELQDFCDKVASACVTEGMRYYPSITLFMEPFISAYLGGTSSIPQGPCRALDMTPTIVTWKGHLLRCTHLGLHNKCGDTPNKIGNLHEWRVSGKRLEECSGDTPPSALLEECKNCFWVHSCKGPCPALDPSDKKKQCENMGYLCSTVFYLFLLGLFPDMVTFEIEEN